MKKNSFKPVKMLLNDYFGVNENFATVIELKKLWHEIAGELMASISYPFRYRNGILHVALTDNAWMSETPYIKAMIAEKVKERGVNIIDIKFMLSKTLSRKKAEHPPLPPLSEEARRTAELISSTIRQ